MIDCHTHTINSPDGYSSVSEMALKAYEKGLSVLAVTDHCEANRFFSIEHYGKKTSGYEYDIYDYGLRFEQSMKDITSAKNEFKGRLDLLCGIELGQATQDLSAADAIAADKRLDFIICSMHELKGYDDFAFLDYNKYDVPFLLELYYEEIYKLCKWGNFDVLGHLTYTLRYIEGKYKIKVDMKPYEDIIRESFGLLIEKGRGIEINTSGLRQEYGKAFPDLYWVKIFREMGGEILTLGSDAHKPEDIGKGIKEGLEIAKEAGFSQICYFKERKPVFIDII